MSQRVTVIYEDGVLRPLSPVELPEHSQVEIDIHNTTSSESQTSHRDQLERIMMNSGLKSSDPAAIISAKPLSIERRQELAQIFSADKPISELINEDRESR